ncbi:MAG: TonB-dependent receptor plug domain-containing protein [Bacteroidota bacterium]
MLLPVFSLLAQDITGRVLAEDRTPILGAYVIHLNSDHHAHSNELGDFEIRDVTVGDSLQISYLGFKTRVVVIEDLNYKLLIRLEETPFQLDQVVVQPNIRALSTVTDIDVSVNPVNSAQEVLRTVPGLIIGQHAGGGKAEQIFLRGFDIDHGTDITISVDGMPINMVSHAHGQGYADLHFIIPEAIQSVDFGKGSYYADQGNFNTAGYVDFRLQDRLQSSMFQTEVGQFNTFRTVGLFDLVDTDKTSAYIGTEYIQTDGPFESSQHFNRLNLMAKLTTQLENQGQLSLLATHFESKWDASGQIPQRAVDAGLIGRFGAIDDTEGGFTGRTNISAEYSKVLSSNSYVKTNAYFSAYDFELFSNFTFFLEDPENGDQIRQFEEREIYGFNTEWNHSFFGDNSEGTIQAGVGFRYDNIDNNELSRTRNRRETLEQIQFGDIDETNLFAYANVEYEIGAFTINPGLRFDRFTFNYVDRLQTLYDRQEQTQNAISPKLNFFYNANSELQLYLKTGIGFHSNDTRVVLDRSAEEILPAAYSADLGAVFRPAPRLFINAALWYLFLEQEFVYVGDAGIVEPSGETRRLGFDVGARFQLNDWLFGTLDVNYALARSVNDPDGQNFIPLAPDLTTTGGLNAITDRFTAGVNYRYLRDRPANEDNSIVAEGYLVIDANANYQIGRLNLGVVVENLLDTDWNETQFATESRLRNEEESVEEIHFTPGIPFFVKGVVRFSF